MNIGDDAITDRCAVGVVLSELECVPGMGMALLKVDEGTDHISVTDILAVVIATGEVFGDILVISIEKVLDEVTMAIVVGEVSSDVDILGNVVTVISYVYEVWS